MNINALMKQAQKMQSDMTKAQRELEKTLFEFDSAGGAIHLSIYGNRKVEKIEIKVKKDNNLTHFVVKINDLLAIIRPSNLKPIMRFNLHS